MRTSIFRSPPGGLAALWPVPLSAAALALGCLGLGPEAAAQTWPLQLVQPALLVNTNFRLGINWQSKAGVPLSSTNNLPPGSDGRAPTVSQQSSNHLTTLPPTANQFQGFLGLGAVPVQGATNLNPSLSFVANARLLNWPRAETNGTVALVLRSAQVGAPYLGQQVSFLFGSVIPVPLTDETGTNTLPLGSSVTYWMAQPYSTNPAYYWSPHARAVFAVQPGSVDITWQKANPEPGTPSPANNYVQFSGVWYRLYTVRYLISGSPVKPSQKIYWTEGSFQNLGKPVDVPQARVSAVNVIFNNAFPERVSAPYVDPGYVPPVPTTNMYQETRTLWFDSTRGQILAYNIPSGRVFVELLGELNPDGVTRKYLGFEIVDVFQQPLPNDVTIELGERVTAYQDGRDDSFLYPSPLSELTAQTFYFQQNLAASDKATLWAARETVNINDFQVHWLIPGVAGLRWPYLFCRYRLAWPSDAAKYSHYLRPLVPTEAEAKFTAVPLPTQNAPIIQYQDPRDQPRGKLTETFAYYTWLVPAYPAHRGLLRFTTGDQVSFERVFSWLDAALKTNSLFFGSVATNLTAWNPANLTFTFGSFANTPRVVSQTVNVGDRILPPLDETWNGTKYWAGYILQTNGNSFNPGAYQDPYSVGFTQANLSAIIPVNAIPNQNQLEVWWFRGNQADGSRGFQRVYWPSVIGRYTLQWPAGAPEIILAANAGSGGLNSLQAKASIYYQNDPTLPGYNPNEEHALMLGGQAYALRDDLNITNTSGYPHAPGADPPTRFRTGGPLLPIAPPVALAPPPTGSLPSPSYSNAN